MKVEVERLRFFVFVARKKEKKPKRKKSQKTSLLPLSSYQLRHLDVRLEVALECAEQDLALARLEPVDHAGDGAVFVCCLEKKKKSRGRQKR